MVYTLDMVWALVHNQARNFVLIMLVGLAASAWFVLAPVVNADEDACANPQSLKAGIDCAKGKFGAGVLTDEATSLSDIIMRVVKFLLSFGALLALAVIVYAGIMYIISLGDDKKTAAAKRMILYAIVGLIIAAASFLIVDQVGRVLNPPQQP